VIWLLIVADLSLAIVVVASVPEIRQGRRKPASADD
jgi:hypothetical protein